MPLPLKPSFLQGKGVLQIVMDIFRADGVLLLIISAPVFICNENFLGGYPKMIRIECNYKIFLNR